MLTPDTLLASLSRTLSRDAEQPEAAAALLDAFHPQNPIQAMLAAQAIALHHAAMDCFAGAMETPAEDRSTITRLHRNAASLTRAFAATLRALQRDQAPDQTKPAKQAEAAWQHPCTFHAPPPGRAAVAWGCGPARRERPKDPAPGAPCMDQRPAGTAATTVQ
jgi:hypothetical protein